VSVSAFLSARFSRWRKPQPTLSVVPDVPPVAAQPTLRAAPAPLPVDNDPAQKAPPLFDQDPPGIKAVLFGSAVAVAPTAKPNPFVKIGPGPTPTRTIYRANPGGGGYTPIVQRFVDGAWI
jgi:hypothetical protein